MWTTHPEIEVDLRLARHFDAPPEEHGVDIAIRFLHGHPEAPQLGQQGWRIGCHPAYFDLLGRPDGLRDLSDVVLLHEAVYNFWPEIFARAKLAVPETARFRALGDASHVLAGILQGNAMAVLPRELTKRAIRDGMLVSPFSPEIEQDEGYFAIIHGAASEPASTAFIKFLCDC